MQGAAQGNRQRDLEKSPAQELVAVGRETWFSPLHHPQCPSSGKNMPSDHTTLNFNHTEKWCYHTINGVNIIYFNDFFFITPLEAWSHQLGLTSVTITCDQILNCCSHHKNFNHTIDIRCRSHHTPFVTPTRYVHTVFVCSYQNSMMYTIESESH